MSKTPAKVPVAKKKSKSPVSNHVQLDAKNPIPFEDGLAFSYLNKSRYVPFLAPNDNFAQDLLSARVLSTTNNACIRSKKDYCAGQGFQYNNEKELPATFAEWCTSVNRKNQSLTKVNKAAFESHFTFGNTPVEVVRYTIAGKRYFHVYSHNLLNWRLGDSDEDGVINYSLFSKLFSQRGFISSDLLKGSKKLPIFSPYNSERKNWFKDEKGAERTLIWYKNDFIGYEHYGLPSNVASMIFQLLEYKGARYNLDNFDNNMVISALLALKGNLSQTEANRIGKDAIKTHTGDGKRGRLLVVASEEGIEGSSFHTFDTHKEGSYTESDDKWTQKIILANDWDAVLAGLQSPSTLGKGAGFISKIIEHKLNTVIKPAQQDLISEVWKHILTIGNEWMGWKLDVANVEFKNNIDISGLTDVDITPAVQVNEVRRAKGLPEDPKKDGVYMPSKLQQNQTDPKPTKEEGGKND